MFVALPLLCHCFRSCAPKAAKHCLYHDFPAQQGMLNPSLRALCLLANSCVWGSSCYLQLNLTPDPCVCLQHVGTLSKFSMRVLHCDCRRPLQRQVTLHGLHSPAGACSHSGA
jgi:hypothetical protein